MRAGAKRLQQLVDDLLDFAKLQSGTFKLDKRDVDLSGPMRAAIDSMRPQAHAASILLTADLPEYMFVHVDAQRVCQAVLNLVSNAIKFTP